MFLQNGSCVTQDTVEKEKNREFWQDTFWVKPDLTQMRVN